MMSVSWKGKSRFQSPLVQDMSIKALKMSTRRWCGKLLDIDKDTFSRKMGDQQDWVGLGELMGVNNDEIQRLALKTERTMTLLEDWSTTSKATIGVFISFLERMERFDILEDDMFQTKVLQDSDKYHEDTTENKIKSTMQPLQVQEVTSGAARMEYEIENPDLEFEGITVNEVETGQPEYFDAFVCATDDDMPYVKQMIGVLEGHYGLKLCIKARDLTVGVANYPVLAHLIEKRCNKMIIVLSPKYLRSPECDFMTKFGHSLSPGARSKKLIPVLIENPVAIPDILRFIALVDYTKCELVEWFWRRLARALQECSLQTYAKQRIEGGCAAGCATDLASNSSPTFPFSPSPMIHGEPPQAFDTSSSGGSQGSTALYMRSGNAQPPHLYPPHGAPMVFSLPGSGSAVSTLQQQQQQQQQYQINPALRHAPVPGYIPMDPSLNCLILPYPANSYVLNTASSAAPFTPTLQPDSGIGSAPPSQPSYKSKPRKNKKSK